jgi:hypothetical protein
VQSWRPTSRAPTALRDRSRAAASAARFARATARSTYAFPLTHLRPTAAAIARPIDRMWPCGAPAAASVWSRARAAKPTLLSTGARVRKWRWQPQHQPQARLRGRWSARGAQWLGSARLGSARLGSARLGLRSSCLHKVSALSSLACHSEQHWLCPSMHCGAFLGAVVHVCLGAFRSVSASAAPSAASSTRTADSTTSAATPCRFGHTSPPRPSVRPPACDHRRARSEPREGFPARRQQAASAVPQWGTGSVREMGKWGTWAEWERRLACR